ncbi:MAG: hypothetical protein ABSG36_19810, partial [Acidimicrobiales bacterium]
ILTSRLTAAAPTVVLGVALKGEGPRKAVTQLTAADQPSFRFRLDQDHQLGSSSETVESKHLRRLSCPRVDPYQAAPVTP